MRRKNKGFTLAELLIVVAIIGVLVAVAIPVFNSQLEKSRQSTDLSNLRGAYAAAKVAELSGEVAGYNSNGDSVDPIKIGDSFNSDWEYKYSAAAYVFLYDSDSGALYPWDNGSNTTYFSSTANLNKDEKSIVMSVSGNDDVYTTMKARSDKIIVDTANLPGGNNGIIQYGYRTENSYNNEKLPGNSKAAWQDMKIVVQFTNDSGVWSLKRGAIRFENVGESEDIPKISLTTSSSSPATTPTTAPTPETTP